MAGKTDNKAIARRYASAFFTLAKEHKGVDNVSADLLSLLEIIDTSADFRNLISNSTLRRDVQASAIAAIGDKAKFSDLTKKLLGTLAINRRLDSLPEIISAVQDEISEHRGEITAEVTSAQKLEAKQVKAIAEALKKVLKKTIIIKVKENPEIIGGLIVQVGSQRIDSSVKAKLERLHRALKSSNTSGDITTIREVA